jgi:hypothetical protein
VKPKYWLIGEFKLQPAVILCAVFSYRYFSATVSFRVAIMKEGRLQASGGPLFLKNRFGLGYNLTVVSETKESSGCGPNRNKQLTSGEELESGVSGLDDEVPGNRLLSFLQGFVPDVLRTRGKSISLGF